MRRMQEPKARNPFGEKLSPTRMACKLYSHSTNGDCNLCIMIFSNISASIVEALRRLPLDGNSPFFVYRLATGKGLEGTALNLMSMSSSYNVTLLPFLLIVERSYSYDMA